LNSGDRSAAFDLAESGTHVQVDEFLVVSTVTVADVKSAVAKISTATAGGARVTAAVL
jgi:hypothetical protein